MTIEFFQLSVSTRGTRRVKRDLKSIGKTAGGVRKTLGFLRAALVVFASIQILSGIGKLADKFTNLRNKLRQVTKSTDQMNKVQQALFAVSQLTGTSLEANATLLFRMTRATGQLGLSFKSLIKITQTIAKTIKLSGAETQEASNALIQFSQGLASGTLRGDELRSVVEQLPELAAIIGKEFNIAGAALATFAKANPGIVTTERILRAIVAAEEDVNTRFKDIRFTIGDAFNRFNNSLVIFLGRLNESTGAGDKLAEVLNTIANNLDKVALGLLAFGTIVVFNLIVGQLAVLGTTLITVAAAIFSPLIAIINLGVAAATSTAALILFRTVVISFKLVMATFAFAILAARTSIFLYTTVIAAAKTTTFGLKLVTLSAAFAIGTLQAAFIIAAGAAKTLRLAILTNPLFLIATIAVIAGLAGAMFLFNESVEDSGGAFQNFKNGFNIIAAGFFAGIKAMTNAWKDLGNVVGEIFTDIAAGPAGFAARKLGFDINPFRGSVDKILTQAKEDFFEELKVDRAGGIQDSLVSGFEIVKDKVLEIIAEVKKFADFGGPLDLDNLGDPKKINLLQDAIAALDRAQKRLRDEFARDVAKVSPLAVFANDARKLKNILDNLPKNVIKEVLGSLTIDEFIKRTTRETLGLSNAALILTETQVILSRQFKTGAISIDEFTIKMREAKIESLEVSRTFSSGVETAFLKLQESFANIGFEIEKVITNAFQSAEDSLVQFVTTGKLKFGELIDSIIADIIRLAIRQAILGPLAGIFGSFFGGPVGSVVGSQIINKATGSDTAFSRFTGANAKGNAFDGAIKAFANGGIIGGPTLFGIAGEAGEEAILPLTRNSRGQLGVSSVGQRSPNLVIGEINIDARGADANVDVRIRAAIKATAPLLVQASREASREDLANTLTRRSL